MRAIVLTLSVCLSICAGPAFAAASIAELSSALSAMGRDPHALAGSARYHALCDQLGATVRSQATRPGLPSLELERCRQVDGLAAMPSP